MSGEFKRGDLVAFEYSPGDSRFGIIASVNKFGLTVNHRNSELGEIGFSVGWGGFGKMKPRHTTVIEIVSVANGK